MCIYCTGPYAWLMKGNKYCWTNMIIIFILYMMIKLCQGISNNVTKNVSQTEGKKRFCNIKNTFGVSMKTNLHLAMWIDPSVENLWKSPSKSYHQLLPSEPLQPDPVWWTLVELKSSHQSSCQSSKLMPKDLKVKHGRYFNFVTLWTQCFKFMMTSEQPYCKWV